jgi:cyclohexanone monooxygenase
LYGQGLRGELVAKDIRVRADHHLSVGNVEFLEACTPGYYNNKGKLGEPGKGFNSEVYAPGINEFNALLETWREQGDLEGLELR